MPYTQKHPRPPTGEIESKVDEIKTEVETTTLNAGEGTITNSSRLGRLARWIADNLNTLMTRIGTFTRPLKTQWGTRWDAASDLGTDISNIGTGIAAIPTNPMLDTEDGSSFDSIPDMALDSTVAKEETIRIITKNTICVNTTGDDTTGDGSFDNPYRTLQKAYDEGVTAYGNFFRILAQDDAGTGYDTSAGGITGLALNANGVILEFTNGVRITNTVADADNVISGSGNGIWIFGGNITLPNVNADEECINLTGDDVWIQGTNMINPIGGPSGYNGIHLTGDDGHIIDCHLRLFDNYGIILDSCITAHTSDNIVEACGVGFYLMNVAAGCILDNSKIMACTTGVVIVAGCLYNTVHKPDFNGNIGNFVNAGGSPTNALVGASQASLITVENTNQQDWFDIYQGVRRNDTEVAIDDYAYETTDGVNTFEILRFDIAGGEIVVADQDVGRVIKSLTGTVYDIMGLTFDLMRSPTAGKNFNTLDGAGGTIDFYITREIDGNDVLMGEGKRYTQATIESDPYSIDDSGSPPIDILSVSGVVKVFIKTSAVLDDLEIPFRFLIARRG